MAAARTRIGFVGLGHMGGNMAARFLAAGYPVCGGQRSREGAEQLIEQGLQWCDTPREVAATADVVFTSVPDDAVLEEVASGAGMEPGSITVLSHSLTIDPASPRFGVAEAVAEGWKSDDSFDRESGKYSLRQDPHGYFEVSADVERGVVVAEHRFGGCS